MLNGIWFALIITAIISSVGHFIFSGDIGIFSKLVQSLFDSAKLSFDVVLGLVGVLAMWMGVFNIALRAGIVDSIAKSLQPVFSKLMPEVPRGDPAVGAMTMNLAANMLGLDNAATPLGLKAMQELQRLNPSQLIASNAQILFIVLNASSVTLLPVTIFMYRAQQGAAAPTDVFLPILIATTVSTLAGLMAVCFMQRISLLQPALLLMIALLVGLIGGVGWLSVSLPQVQFQAAATAIANCTLLFVLTSFLVLAMRRKVPVFDAFVDGAKEGFDTAIRLIPFLVAMLLAVGLLRASGALDFVLELIRSLVAALHVDARFVDALPTALIKPFSGSGARAMMIETMKTFGPDSFAARTSAVIQGSTETTFYVSAVYFGVVGIRNVRHAIGCALFADFAGVVASIIVSYLFFG